jgi:hypothetical protein
VITILRGVADYISEDWKTNPIRCSLEVIAWFLSIACSLTMAATLPNPPFLILYPMFIIQCAIFGWAAYTRRSTGMVANYALLVGIDITALARLVVHS